MHMLAGLWTEHVLNLRGTINSYEVSPSELLNALNVFKIGRAEQLQEGGG